MPKLLRVKLEYIKSLIRLTKHMLMNLILAIEKAFDTKGNLIENLKKLDTFKNRIYRFIVYLTINTK